MNGFFCLSRTLRRERSVLAAGLRPEVRTQGHVRGGWPGPRREPGHMGPRGPGGQQRLAQGPGGPRSQALVGPLGAAALPTDPFPTPWVCAAWPAVKTLPPAFPGWGLPHRPGQGHPSQSPPPAPITGPVSCSRGPVGGEVVPASSVTAVLMASTPGAWRVPAGTLPAQPRTKRSV